MKEKTWSNLVVSGMWNMALKYEIYKTNWFLTVKQNPTVDTFKKAVLKTTNTFFFKKEDEMYGITFNKKENVGDIYKTGKDCEKILATINMEDIIKDMMSINFI